MKAHTRAIVFLALTCLVRFPCRQRTAARTNPPPLLPRRNCAFSSSSDAPASSFLFALAPPRPVARSRTARQKATTPSRRCSIYFPSPTPSPQRLKTTISNDSSSTSEGTSEHVLNEPSEESKLSEEFRGMMSTFTAYTADDISSVKSSRYRSLYEGVAAGGCDVQVLKAFTVLYEDYLPIRIAGRMIYRHLCDVMDSSRSDRDAEVAKVESDTGLPAELVRRGRGTFMAIASDGDTSGSEEGLTVAQVIDSGIVDTIVELSGYDDFDSLIDAWDENKNGQLEFGEFMIGLQRCSVDSGGESPQTPECNVSKVLELVASKVRPLEERGNRSKLTAERKKAKYSSRYDDMVKSFGEWEDNVSTTQDGRLADVLRGCFVGARNPKVVKALKIVYTDYSALRVGGDLIFKLMSKLVSRR